MDDIKDNHFTESELEELTDLYNAMLTMRDSTEMHKFFVDPEGQSVVSECAVHRAGIEIRNAEFFSDCFRNSAFAASARSVQSNYHNVLLYS